MTRRLLIPAIVCMLTWAGIGSAEPMSTLLEKAVYTEETAGDLDGAIKLYQQIVKTVEADRALVAQAYYRLGQCLARKGQNKEAIEAFKRVTADYADQKDVVAKALQQLSKLDYQPLKLQPAPWADGEIMRLRISSAAGANLGSTIYAVRSGKAGGRDVWQLESWLFTSINNMLQYTRVDADRDSFAPVTGRTANSLLGDFQAVYQPDKVKLTVHAKGQDKTHTLDLNRPVYDNEEALQMLRRMPLAEGYKASFWIFPVIGGTIVQCRIEVTGKEEVTVPAGTYECHKMDLSVWDSTVKALEHHLWFTADAHRWLAKYESGAAVMELTEVSTIVRDKPVQLADAELGVSMTLPAGWQFVRHKANHEIIQLLPPGLDTWAVLAVDKGSVENLSVRKVAEGEIRVLKDHFKDYTVRKDSWQDLRVADLPAARFIADYQNDGKNMIEYRTYIVGKQAVYWFVFRIEKNGFDAMRATYDGIVGSFAAKSPASAPARPSAVKTSPEAFANGVSASLKEISVTFDRKMMDLSWSWVQESKETFPKTTGEPRYDGTLKTCSLPVQLEPGKVYWVGINNGEYTNFQTPDKLAAQPCVILFATRGADGKPTPIPEEMIARAKAINDLSREVSSQPAASDAMSMLDGETRKQVEKYEREFASWFRPEGRYEAASQSGKDAMSERWIQEARGDDFKTRTRAIAALGNIRCEGAVAALIAVAEEPMSNNRPKWMAVRGLGRIGDKAAVPTLIELIDHGNLNVKVYSRLALAQITGQYLGDSKEKWRSWWKEHGAKTKTTGR
ncbi:MAG TPA: HEAT repeat domain-containing protein [Phycisphaerae bacterium]|nr:HEAT repeat domain-containing protein [Phycisphaerae bacterium]